MFSELIRKWIQTNCNRWLHGDGLKVEFGITGTVTLNNLHLRTEELDLLQLPLEVKHVFIERVHFDIPLAGGQLGKLLIEGSGFYMVANTQSGAKAEANPRASRLALQALIHIWSMSMAKVFSQIMLSRNKQNTSLLLGTDALLGLKASKTAKGASAGVALRSLMTLMHGAKVSLKDIHIRIEDKGSAGTKTLDWEGPPIATGIIIGSLEISKSDQPADSKFPELPEWDVEGAEGTASIDHTFTTKGLTIYWKDLEATSGGFYMLGEMPLAEAIVELRRPFLKKPSDAGAAEETAGANDCAIDDSMICLLQNVELSLRTYVQVNMGTSVSAELYSFPWRVVAFRCQLLAPVIHVAITEEQIKIVTRIMALVQGWVRTLQRGAMTPVPRGRSFRNAARERWGMIRSAVRRDFMRRSVYEEKSLNSAQVWRSYFQTWREAARYIAARRLLRNSQHVAFYTFKDGTGTAHTRFFEGEIGQMEGSGEIPELEEGDYDHIESISAEDLAAAELLLKPYQAREDGFTPPPATLKALYAIQVQMDSVMPPRVSAACRLLEHMRNSHAVGEDATVKHRFPFLGCLLVMVADITDIRPIIANAGLDAYCSVTLRSDTDKAPVEGNAAAEGNVKSGTIPQKKTTDIADFHVTEQRALWGQILPFACPTKTADGPGFSLEVSCMDKGVMMDHTIGSATLTQEAITADSHSVLEHQLPLMGASGGLSGEGIGSALSSGSNARTKSLRLFTVYIPEGFEASAASKAKEDLLTVVNKIAAETTPDEQQTATRSRWDFWSTPEADLCVDIGLLKVVLSSTVRTGESVALDPALDVQMHQMSMYATAGPSKNADIHAGNIWLTWTAQFDLLRLLLLPRPASAGLTASPLDVKLGPLTLSTDLSPDAIRDALSRIDRDSYSKMKPHDVLAYLAANTPMRVGGECGAYRVLLSSMGKIAREIGSNVVWKPERYIFDLHTAGDVHTSSKRAESAKATAKKAADSVSSLRIATGFGLLVGEMDEFIDHYQRASEKATNRSTRATSGDETKRTTWQIPTKEVGKPKANAGGKSSWFGSLSSQFGSSSSSSSSDWQVERDAMIQRISKLEAQLTEAGMEPAE